MEILFTSDTLIRVANSMLGGIIENRYTFIDSQGNTYTIGEGMIKRLNKRITTIEELGWIKKEKVDLNGNVFWNRLDKLHSNE